ncbi:hypothetical protein [Natrarchaeobius oligotrophus]|uniref:Uncharacterized protein n=1 Tax=Natrarchaeobius chitinivorans TaxID=1679083 RepID=A0A3N6MLA1_NATCH|nr:hypothetical protein [Natrarchaeobius chitinivorans]RQG96771.1 hypothetical protein EA472_20190 [Natrarchaeobius chitinivorans]
MEPALESPGVEPLEFAEATAVSDSRKIPDGATVDDAACDRCGDPISERRVISLSSQPCPALADSYAAVTKAYCPDCVAGIGMLALVDEPRARTPGALE